MPLCSKEVQSSSLPFSFSKQEAIYSAATEEEENDFSHLYLSEEEDKRQSATASNQHDTVDHFNRYENVGNFLTYLSDYSIESVGDGGDSATLMATEETEATTGLLSEEVRAMVLRQLDFFPLHKLRSINRRTCKTMQSVRMRTHHTPLTIPFVKPLSHSTHLCPSKKNHCFLWLYSRM